MKLHLQHAVSYLAILVHVQPGHRDSHLLLLLLLLLLVGATILHVHSPGDIATTSASGSYTEAGLDTEDQLSGTYFA